MAWREQLRGVRRRRPSPGFTCGSCGRRYANPLTHVCAPKSDFAKRRRTQQRAAAAARRKADRAARRQRERHRITAVRKAERAKADRRVAAAKAKRRRRGNSRPRPQKHDYARCRDADCERIACEAYREGLAEGEMIGRAAAAATGGAS